MRAQTAAERMLVLADRIGPVETARIAALVLGVYGLDHVAAQAFVESLDDIDREALYGALMVHQSCHAPRLPEGDVDLAELTREPLD